MPPDRDRIAEVLDRHHSYYLGAEPQSRIDTRLNPAADHFIGEQLEPGMRVLDVGCGDGATLLKHSARFAEGVGIDNDPDHLDLAEAARRERAVDNVRFELLDVADLPDRSWHEAFDVVFSERGPIGYEARNLQAALHVLRPGGLVFCETMGELHHQEVREVFGEAARMTQLIRALEQVRVAMERNGVGIRLAADVVSKRYYPDLYEWLQFQCDIWAWAGRPLPSPDDPRFELFARRNRTLSGEIETTHHVVWVAGIKLADPPPYAEYQHFHNQSAEPGA